MCGSTDLSKNDGTQVFTVPEADTVACTITNQLQKTDPKKATTQAGRAQLFDDITITDIQPGASNAGSATATFNLYSDAACSTLVGTFGPVALSYSSGGTTASASTLSGSGISINAGTTYYWRVAYSGDAFNNSFTTACGTETGTVTFTFVE